MSPRSSSRHWETAANLAVAVECGWEVPARSRPSHVAPANRLERNARRNFREADRLCFETIRHFLKTAEPDFVKIGSAATTRE